ncbi:hypothetical protein GRI97_09845 [Altererythrobacter xixiisoli]|uniref:Uncharacterized protein n=1 Tax=Croceibacterium xixiisoli TaxID=1476466 RepID=A0A6I4TVZ5_9SPHN|nr:hypothetical protein [Croceibacterium xixiisoli]MXO99291.1 hypothetical protein [Croceibacterium xixiisoli]
MGRAWRAEDAQPVNELDVVYVLSVSEVPEGGAALSIEKSALGFHYRLERELLCYESPAFETKPAALDSAFLHIRRLGITRVHQILPHLVREEIPRIPS